MSIPRLLHFSQMLNVNQMIKVGTGQRKPHLISPDEAPPSHAVRKEMKKLSLLHGIRITVNQSSIVGLEASVNKCQERIGK